MAKRTKAYGINNPLQDVFPVPVVAQRAPTVNDAKAYEIGQIWVDQTTGQIYGLASVSGGSAIWSILGPGASDVDTLTGDTVGALSPTAGNINILGGAGLTVAGAGSTLTITPDAESGFPITPYVVGPVGSAGFQTIQAAIDASVSDGGVAAAIYVQPGQYTEDLDFSGATVFTVGLTMQGVCALGDEGQTEIVGTHTPPASGVLVLRNFRLSDATAIFSSAAAGTGHLVVIDAEFNVTNGFSFDLVNWNGIFEFFDTNPGTGNDGFINNTGGSSLFMFAAGIGMGTVNTMVLSGLVVLGFGSISCPVNFTTGATLSCDVTQFNEPVTFGANTNGQISYGQFTGGAAAAITMSSSGNIVLPAAVIESTNDPAIDGAGAGTLSLTGVDFTDSSTLAATLTLGAGDTVTGNIILPIPASQLQMEGGAVTDFIGQATLVAGTVTVANTNISATDKILVTREGIGASTALGVLDVGITAATSFTITALQPATPGSTETNDLSVVNYFIVRQL